MKMFLLEVVMRDKNNENNIICCNKTKGTLVQERG